jgi:hypothetical protein
MRRPPSFVSKGDVDLEFSCVRLDYVREVLARMLRSSSISCRRAVDEVHLEAERRSPSSNLEGFDHRRCFRFSRDLATTYRITDLSSPTSIETLAFRASGTE